MSDYFSIPGGGFAADVTVDGNSVYASATPEWPILVFTLQMNFHGQCGLKTALDFRELRCRLIPFEASYIAMSLPAPIQLRLTSGNHVPNQWLHLEVPLDRYRIALVNRMRNGGDVKLKLDLELFADELVEIASINAVPPQSIWGLKQHYRMTVHTHVLVPRSQWVDRILPATGFGKIHILELPAIPLESCAEIKKAFEALQQAFKFESEGLYVEAVSKCRFALEPFLEIVEKPGGKGKIPQLKSSWQTRLGKATYDWLNASFGAIKGPMNEAHHISSTSFGQLEAQMLLNVTTALVAYAVKTQPK